MEIGHFIDGITRSLFRHDPATGIETPLPEKKIAALVGKA
jgi:hypothetical protein